MFALYSPDGVTAFDSGAFKPGHYVVELQIRDFNAPEGSELRSKGYVLQRGI